MNAVAALSLALAVISANENSLRATPDDIGLHFQVIQEHGDTPAQQLAWLTRHSARVFGDRECHVQRNCTWTRALWRNPDARPPTLARGAWSPRRWDRIRAYARALVDGRVINRPCPERVVSWGSSADFEVNRFNYRPIQCRGARNLGAAPTRRPSRVPLARVPRSSTESGRRPGPAEPRRMTPAA